MKLQFRIQHVLILMAFAAIAVGWWVDRTRLLQRIEELEQPTIVNGVGDAVVFSAENDFVFARDASSGEVLFRIPK